MGLDSNNPLRPPNSLDQVPKCHFPNYIGRPKHTRVMAGALEGDLFVGPKAQEHRGLLSIRYPMEHGIVTGKSLSEALLFAEHRKNMFVVYKNCSECQKQFLYTHSVLIRKH